MPVRPKFIRPAIFPLVGSLLLTVFSPAAPIRTLPDTEVTASDDSIGGSGLGTTVLASETLDLFQTDTLAEISLLTPNLYFSTSDTRGYGDIISMRGVTNTLFFSSPAVGLYVDDVPFSNAFLYPDELVRLQDVSVHHGPQGSSFGLNGAAGMIDVTTLQPTQQFQYGGSFEYGSDEHMAMSVYSAGPLGGDFSHSFQFYARDRNGFINNTFRNQHTDFRSVVGGLANIVWTPSPDMEFKLRFAAESVDDGSQRLSALRSNPNPFAAPGRRFRVKSNVRGDNEVDRYQISLHGRKDFDWGTLKSITSYQDWDLGPQRTDLDLGSSPFPLTEANSLIYQDSDIWTQEFRIESPEGAGPLSWRGGLFYSSKEDTGKATRNFPVITDFFAAEVGEKTDFRIDQETFAVFGHGAYALDNGITLEAGARVEWVDVSLNRSKSVTFDGFPGPSPGRLSPDSDDVYFSPTGGLVYDLNEKTSFFARTGLGIKPHGYTAFSDNPRTASFDEETNWSNEIGVHYNCADCNFNGVLRAFWNQIDDYQLNVQSNVSTDFIVVNADEVVTYGIEAEANWRPMEALLLHGSLGLINAEFEDYRDPFTGTSYDNNNVPFVPELTASAGFRYDLPQGFFVASSIRAAGDTYYDAANESDYKQGSYMIWDAQAGYQAEHWSISVFGRNMTDEDYYTFINPQIDAGAPGDPQVFGVRVDVDLW